MIFREYECDTVLVVDEEPVTLLTLATIFENAGYRVLRAATAEQALQQFREHPVDLVVMDNGLLDAEDLGPGLKRLKPAVPILLFSSVPFSRKPTTYADAVAIKPEEPRVLLQKIALLVQRSHQRAA